MTDIFSYSADDGFPADDGYPADDEYPANGVYLVKTDICQSRNIRITDVRRMTNIRQILKKMGVQIIGTFCSPMKYHIFSTDLNYIDQRDIVMTQTSTRKTKFYASTKVGSRLL